MIHFAPQCLSGQVSLSAIFFWLVKSKKLYCSILISVAMLDFLYNGCIPFCILRSWFIWTSVSYHKGAWIIKCNLSRKSPICKNSSVEGSTLDLVSWSFAVLPHHDWGMILERMSQECSGSIHIQYAECILKKAGQEEDGHNLKTGGRKIQLKIICKL